MVQHALPLTSLPQHWDQRTPDGTRMSPSLGYRGIQRLQPQASALGSDVSSHLGLLEQEGQEQSPETLSTPRAREGSRNLLNSGDSQTCTFSTPKSEGWIPQCTAASSVPSSLRVGAPRARRRKQVPACPAQNQPKLFQQVRARWARGAAPCMEEKENGSPWIPWERAGKEARSPGRHGDR